MGKWSVIENIAILATIILLAVFADTLWGLLLILALNGPDKPPKTQPKSKL